MSEHDPIETYMNHLVPTVIEQTNRGERAFDIYSRPFERADYLFDRRSKRSCLCTDLRAASVS